VYRMLQNQMNNHFYAVIMAGGGGTRLWPLSRSNSPKQSLRLTEEGTLFQLAVKRLDGLFDPSNILVVTIAEQAAALQKQAPQVPVENYLIEPMPRGTASVVGLAAVAIQKRDPQSTMAVLTADHFIANVPKFQQSLKAACSLAQEGYLMTLGITPTFPATGYGYIQRGDFLLEMEGMPGYLVKRFQEKPALELAEKFIQTGDHDWNSGMFIWRVDRILEEFHKHMPELAGQLDRIGDAWNTSQRDAVLGYEWPLIKPQTIDYGIMEKASRLGVIPVPDLEWNDVGSWESLFEVLPGDENGNIVLQGNYINIGTKKSMFFSSSNERLVVTIGLENMIVIDTGDALLVCSRKDAQQVRNVVQILKDRGEKRYL
jgi:mannose-1-phosphate guanylyltransferase